LVVEWGFVFPLATIFTALITTAAEAE
jgi:hypothetical protein